MLPPLDEPSGRQPDRMVYITFGGGPPHWHVRDQEARIRALPPCPVLPADRADLEPVRLRPYAATLWLPDPRRAEPTEVPDETTIQGWRWPSGDSLHLMTYGNPELPGLRAIEVYGSEACRALLAGRPVSVERRAEVTDRGTAFHLAVVSGFLDERTHVHVDVIAGTAERRDALLAALLTLTVDAAAGAEPGGERAGG
jgi:hypothetical protein